MRNSFSGSRVSISNRLAFFFAVLIATTTGLSAQEASNIVEGSYNDVQVIPTGQVIVPESSGFSPGLATAAPVILGTPIGVVEGPANLTYSTMQDGFQYDLPQTSQNIWYSQSTFNSPTSSYEQGSIQYGMPSQAGVFIEHGMSYNPTVIYSKDIGYKGPGDMRTHLWKDHSADLQRNGISHAKLMAMPMPLVQKWHNFFHGSEGSPEGQH